MHNEKTVVDLLGPLYEAVTDSTQWSQFLSHLSATLQAPWCAIHVEDLSQHRCAAHVQVGFDPAFDRSYHEYYASKNVFLLQGRQRFQVGAVVPSSAVCSDAVYFRSEFYNEWAAPQGLHRSLNGTISSGPATVGVIDVLRGKSMRPFDESDVTLLGNLMPHLQRAVQLHQLFVGLSTSELAARESLDRWGMGVFLVDDRARVVSVNRAAEDVLQSQSGLRVENGCLRASNARESARLIELILDAAISRNAPGAAPGGAMVITRANDLKPFRVLVAPVTHGGAYFGVRRAQCAVFVENPAVGDETDREFLKTLYGLTEAESKVAALMVQGLTTKEIAERCGVSHNTSKTHVRHVYDRTGTRRHAELVAAILSAPTSKRMK